ncbi:hypothetical protein EAF04_002026 [Stromatinia cepivora]|nr:hypothetical protein EAF04_002026 [Stromatinia cepivora]
MLPHLRPGGVQESENDGKREEEEEEEGEKEEEEEKEGGEDEEHEYTPYLHPDDAIESIEEDDIDLTGKVKLFNAAYHDGYPYCAESHAFKWTEVPGHLTARKVRAYDYHAFWANCTTVEVNGLGYLQQNFTGELWRPSATTRGPEKSWCCGRPWCWGHGDNEKWI